MPKPIDTSKLSPAAQTFLVTLAQTCGNNYLTAKDLAYYEADLYTWFFPRDLIKKGYTKEQVGGFLNHMETINAVQNDDDGHSVTIQGIRAAIELLNADVLPSDVRDKKFVVVLEYPTHPGMFEAEKTLCHTEGGPPRLFDSRKDDEDCFQILTGGKTLRLARAYVRTAHQYELDGHAVKPRPAAI